MRGGEGVAAKAGRAYQIKGPLSAIKVTKLAINIEEPLGYFATNAVDGLL